MARDTTRTRRKNASNTRPSSGTSATRVPPGRPPRGEHQAHARPQTQSPRSSRTPRLDASCRSPHERNEREPDARRSRPPQQPDRATRRTWQERHDCQWAAGPEVRADHPTSRGLPPTKQRIFRGSGGGRGWWSVGAAYSERARLFRKVSVAKVVTGPAVSLGPSVGARAKEQPGADEPEPAITPVRVPNVRSSTNRAPNVRRRDDRTRAGHRYSSTCPRRTRTNGLGHSVRAAESASSPPGCPGAPAGLREFSRSISTTTKVQVRPAGEVNEGSRAGSQWRAGVVTRDPVLMTMFATASPCGTRGPRPTRQVIAHDLSVPHLRSDLGYTSVRSPARANDSPCSHGWASRSRCSAGTTGAYLTKVGEFLFEERPAGRAKRFRVDPSKRVGTPPPAERTGTQNRSRRQPTRSRENSTDADRAQSSAGTGCSRTRRREITIMSSRKCGRGRGHEPKFHRAPLGVPWGRAKAASVVGIVSLGRARGNEYYLDPKPSAGSTSSPGCTSCVWLAGVWGVT